MTNDRIIELAKQAGLYIGTKLSGVTLVGAAKSNGLLIHITVDDLASFSAFVRNATLEEAAMVCEQLGQATNGTYERNYECAAAIRQLKDRQ